MGERDHYLHGADDVRSAANTMSHAADRMSSAASGMHEAACKFQNTIADHEMFMTDWLEKLTALMGTARNGR